jgi:predicted DNA-binding antitoxin AbrB/MazE fold protein
MLRYTYWYKSLGELVMPTVHAIFENGVFRPVQPVVLPEHAEVEFEPRIISKALELETHSAEPSAEGLRSIYSLLSERYASSSTDTAARHNEHQP